MPKYISRIKYADQDIKNIPDAVKKTDMVRSAIESLGGNLQQYMTLDRYNVVVISEVPNDVEGVTISLAIRKCGNVQVETSEMLTNAGIPQIVQGLP